MRLILLISFLSISSYIYVRDQKYIISDIPKPILAYSKAVIRKSETLFEISGDSKAVLKKVYAVSILNKNGIPLSVFTQVYDKFSSVRNIKATVYDQNGNIVHTGLNTEILDVAANPGYSLYDDFRVKILDPKYGSIPFTVEFSYEISYNGLLSYPSWVLNNEYNVSIEQSSLTVLTPYKFKLRYLERNLNTTVNIFGKDGKIAYEWKVTSLPALQEEPFSLSILENSPAVFLAPGDFEIGGYKGNCESWTNFGKWIKSLSVNKRLLDENTKAKIKLLIANDTSNVEKVRKLYMFMQNKVRYVSIQIGIGGWQPIDAESVNEVSYGDCKALSNYMRALLGVARIKSYYTLVRAGEDAPALFDEFPSNQFNHAIVCVPIKSDTLWLECTDQEIPFGFLGTFTDDRKVLLIGDSGGVVVRTRAYSVSDNTQTRIATVKIEEEGNAESTVSTEYRGLKYDTLRRMLNKDDFDKKKYILGRIRSTRTELKSFNYNENKSGNPSIIEGLQINIPEFGSFVDRKLIFRPNFLNVLSSLPVKVAQRKSLIAIRRSYCEKDSITFLLKIPIKSESKPLNYSLKSDFGEYECRVTFDKEKIYYVRLFKLKKGNYPAINYSSFVDFFDAIQTEDNKQIVLER
jgi:hypothetical protein